MSPRCVPPARPVSLPRVSPPPRAPAELWDRRAQEVAGRRGRGRRAAGRAGRDGGRGRRAPHSLRPDAGPGAPRAGAQRPERPGGDAGAERATSRWRRLQVSGAAPEIGPPPGTPPEVGAPSTAAPGRPRPGPRAAVGRLRSARRGACGRTGTGARGPRVPSRPPRGLVRPGPGPVPLPVPAGPPGALQPGAPVRAGARPGPGHPRRGGRPGWARARHPHPSPRGVSRAPLLPADATCPPPPPPVSGRWGPGPRALPRPCALRPGVSFTFCSAGREGCRWECAAVVGAECSDLTLALGPKADCEFPRFQSDDGVAPVVTPHRCLLPFLVLDVPQPGPGFSPEARCTLDLSLHQEAFPIPSRRLQPAVLAAPKLFLSPCRESGGHPARLFPGRLPEGKSSRRSLSQGPHGQTLLSPVADLPPKETTPVSTHTSNTGKNNTILGA
ncbi:hypothetical protein J1605_003619 [Eschrichtius robustus]|uniref:Basic proline-rich protein-like n=1 Tax=Eschrichtius robustus TaxID=9764 RepID=A0AB34HRC4_ESCRO|nr:hypothetical protein J1605_003619 [Eschrichtius robustus]